MSFPLPKMSLRRKDKTTSSRPTIALTFDDGPDPTFTPEVLRILEQHGVAATFFCLGEAVERHPELTRQAARNGHMIGNHSWSHPHMTSKEVSASDIRRELSATSAVVQKAVGGAPPLFFRPPYGETSDGVVETARQLGLAQSLWTIDSRDWEPKRAEDIIDTTLGQAADGGVILMHDGGGDRSETVRALPVVISRLKERGFRFVTLSSSYNISR